MSVNSETKRRSVLGMAIMALVIAPVPDGTVAAVDREHITGIYAGIPPSSPGVATDHIHIFSSGTAEPNHATDIANNVLFAGDIEVQGVGWFGGATNYSKIDSGGIQTFNGAAAINGLRIKRTSITSSPYTVLATDDHISLTTVSTAITLNLPAIIDGAVYHFKDQDENASGNNITLSPNGAETIENAASLVITNNGASVTLVGNSTTSNWEIQ